jgi:hypothetical protein
VSGDILPTIIGLAWVAAAPAFALVPFARAAQADAPTPEEASAADRFLIYRRVLELEFDHDMGKLSAEDYALQSAALLEEAGVALRVERGSIGELDEEIEREIAAARAAFAAARRPRRNRKTAAVRS